MTKTVDLNRPRITVWRVLKIYCYVVGLGTTVLAAHLTMAKLYDGTWQKVSPHVGFLGAEVVQMAGNTVLFEPIKPAAKRLQTAAVNPAKNLNNFPSTLNEYDAALDSSVENKDGQAVRGRK